MTIINSSHYAQLLKMAREKAKRSIEEMAISLDISVAAYHDLESFDDEVFDCISLPQLILLGNLLQLDLITFFSNPGEMPQPMMSLEDLADKIKEFLETSKITIDEFQDQAGWEGIDECLKDPSKFLQYNLTGLMDISETVGVNWLSVISGMKQSYNH